MIEKTDKYIVSSYFANFSSSSEVRESIEKQEKFFLFLQKILSNIQFCLIRIIKNILIEEEKGLRMHIFWKFIGRYMKKIKELCLIIHKKFFLAFV